MELDALRTEWAAMSSRLEKLEAQNVTLTAERAQRRTRSTRLRLLAEPVLETIVAIPLMIALAPFFARLSGMGAAPILWAPAVLMMLFLASIVFISITQFALIERIDFAKSVAEAQSALAAIRKIRVRSTASVIIAMAGIWSMPLILLIQVLGTPEVLFKLPTGWLVSNALGSWAFFAIAWILIRRFGPNSKVGKWTSDILAGDAVIAAEKDAIAFQDEARSSPAESPT